MPNVPDGPPSAGWYARRGDPNDLIYSDGLFWTWRRWRLPSGEWRQEPIRPPSTTLPEPAVPAPPPPALSPAPLAGGLPPAARPPTAAVPPQRAGPAQPGGLGPPPGPGGSWSGPPPSPAPPGRLDLHLSEPQRQSRWKTLLRGLLVLPNALVVAFLGIAVAIVTVLMWFAALFTGRVPGGMWRFSKGVLQWVARTDAYTLFLTDRYPPFETGDAAYPVSVTLDPPDRFNRLAVLFRVVLVIPAAVVASAFTFGVYVFAVVPWLVTLVVGRCPRSLHLVLAAWLRYELRYSAYYGLLATEYPWGPLGDRRSAFGSLESGEIVLRGASKALAVVAIVLGAALYVSDAALPVLLAPSARAQTAVAQLHALQSRTVAADAKFRARAATCATTWRCVGDDTSILEQALQTQISTIEAIGFPSDRTRHDAASILAILEEERSELSRVQGAGTPQAFASDMNRIVTLTRRLQPLVLQLQEDLGSAR